VYFVTICAQGRESLFGEITDGEMVLNGFGGIVREEWLRSAEIRKEIILDEFVVMPNHFHGIIMITGMVGAHGGAPNTTGVAGHGHDGVSDEKGARRAPLRASKSLGSFIAGFKSAVTKRINHLRENPGCPVWQRNYFERVIRNVREFAAIREYIANNPVKWAMDKENPANHGMYGRTAVRPQRIS
jgi:putative transposase